MECGSGVGVGVAVGIGACVIARAGICVGTARTPASTRSSVLCGVGVAVGAAVGVGVEVATGVGVGPRYMRVPHATRTGASMATTNTPRTAPRTTVAFLSCMPAYIPHRHRGGLTGTVPLRGTDLPPMFAPPVTGSQLVKPEAESVVPDPLLSGR